MMVLSLLADLGMFVLQEWFLMKKIRKWETWAIRSMLSICLSATDWDTTGRCLIQEIQSRCWFLERTWYSFIAQWLVSPGAVFNIFGILIFLSYAIPSPCVAEGRFFSYLQECLKLGFLFLGLFCLFWLNIISGDVIFFCSATEGICRLCTALNIFY